MSSSAIHMQLDTIISDHQHIQNPHSSDLQYGIICHCSLVFVTIRPYRWWGIQVKWHWLVLSHLTWQQTLIHVQRQRVFIFYLLWPSYRLLIITACSLSMGNNTSLTCTTLYAARRHLLALLKVVLGLLLDDKSTHIKRSNKFHIRKSPINLRGLVSTICTF